MPGERLFEVARRRGTAPQVAELGFELVGAQLLLGPFLFGDVAGSSTEPGLAGPRDPPAQPPPVPGFALAAILNLNCLIRFYDLLDDGFGARPIGGMHEPGQWPRCDFSLRPAKQTGKRLIHAFEVSAQIDDA